MLEALKRITERSVLLSSINYFKGQVLYRLKLEPHLSGATHSKLTIEQSLDYVRKVAGDYLTYAGVTSEFVNGKNILEIGPGDNLGVALCFIAMGASSVTCLDRFLSQRDQRRNAEIYHRLMEGFCEEEKNRALAAIKYDKHEYVSFLPDKIAYLHGFPIEGAYCKLGPEKFDLIVSRAVLEHVYDLEASWHSMLHLLRPGGQMWHKIDFRNHNLFDQFHPLYFLSFGNRMWTLISSPDPTLNRELLPSYRRLASASFPVYEIYYTSILGRGELLPHKRSISPGIDYCDAAISSIRAIKPALKWPYSEMTEEELMVTGIFLICKLSRESGM